MIENDDSDGILIDSFFLITDDHEYGITGWCIESGTEPQGYDGFASTNNSCGDTAYYTNYDTLCIDNDPDECAPGQIISYFDMDATDQYITVGIPEGASNLDVYDIPTCNPTTNPTTNPTMTPTVDPTQSPTPSPTGRQGTGIQPSFFVKIR